MLDEKITKTLLIRELKKYRQLLKSTSEVGTEQDYTKLSIKILDEMVNLYRIAIQGNECDVALANNEEQYRSTINGLDDLIHVIDTNYSIVLCNRALVVAAKKYSEIAGSPLNQNVFTVFSFLEDKVKKEYQKVFETGQIHRTKNRNFIDGTEIWTETQKIPIKGDTGNVFQIITIIRDITEFIGIEKSLKKVLSNLEERVQQRTRDLTSKNIQLNREISEHKKTEIALQRSQKTSQALLNASTESAFLIDIDETILMLNETAARRLEATPDQLIGANFADLLSADIFKVRKKHAQKVIKTGKPITFEDKRENVWFDTTIYPVFDSRNQVVQLAVYGKDITNQKRIEEEQIKTQKLESIGVLAGGIAHDFNNLLTAILGHVTLAKNRSLDNERVTILLHRAESTIYDASCLTQQLLTFSKGGTPVKKPADIGRIITESADFATRGSRGRCKITIPGNLWSAEVDDGQIRQVMNNLIINAVQATIQGNIIYVSAKNRTLKTKEVNGLEPGSYLVITVKDQGMGIKPEIQSRVFDPYFSTKSNGSGLGLAIAYSIIRDRKSVV